MVSNYNDRFVVTVHQTVTIVLTLEDAVVLRNLLDHMGQEDFAKHEDRGNGVAKLAQQVASEFAAALP